MKRKPERGRGIGRAKRGEEGREKKGKCREKEIFLGLGE
jgi:hypothetical protein